MPKGQDRTRRIGEQMRRDLAVAVPQILDHPHASLLSITAVRVTRDLSFAKVYVTHVINDADERQTLLRALNAHAGQLRHALAQKLSIRKMPELHFVYDDSVEYGARMDHLLHDLVKDLPPEEADNIPQVAFSLEQALDALEADNAFLKQGDVFSDDLLKGYIELKRQEVEKMRLQVHPLEFELYYSC